MPAKKNVKRVLLKRTTRSRKPKVAPAIKSYVTRALRSNVETKMATLTYTLTSFNGTITSVPDLITALPTVTQGVDTNQRIGQKVKPLKIVIRGYVIYNTDDIAGTGLLDARMLGGRLFLYQSKGNKNFNNSIYESNLLDIGSSTKQFTGTAMDWITPTNKNLFTFYKDKKFIVQKPYGTTNDSSPAHSTTINCMNKSLYTPFVFTLTQKQLPAFFNYDDSLNLSYPVNFNPNLSLGYCDLLNKTADTVTSQLQMEFISTLYYEDA